MRCGTSFVCLLTQALYAVINKAVMGTRRTRTDCMTGVSGLIKKLCRCQRITRLVNATVNRVMMMKNMYSSKGT